MKSKKLFLIAISIALFALGTCANLSAAVYIKKAPPAKRIVVKPVRPNNGAVWVSGHWSSKGTNYKWVEGYWVNKRPGFKWIDGHWRKTLKGWTWIKGRWVKL